MTRIHAAIASTPESDATRALREARDTITDLKRRLPFSKYEAIEDPGLEATGFYFERNDVSHELRLSLFRGATRNVLGWIIFSSPAAHDFAKSALREYDTLEGID